MKTAFIVLLFASAILAQNHILITEVVVTPTDGEFIEIYNNTSSSIDLSDYYVTDATYATGGNYYYNIVTGSNAGGGSNSDFHARFPDGSSIASGEYQTIGIKGSGFVSTYGKNPTYELYDTNGAIPDMREALSGSIDGGSTLTNGGEVVILYYWDGQTDLVSDVDYYLWGDKAEAVDKTGVSVDGPDDGSTTSTYLADTPIASQIVSVNGQPHEFGKSSQRTTLIETGETQSGGNGLTGHNEMSENLASSFIAAAPNPGSGPGGSSSPSITNIIRIPQEPGPSDVVAISAQITDDGTISSTQLFSSINDGPYNSTAMTNISGDTYEAQIDSQSIGTVVKYYIHAEDNDAEVTQTDTMSYTVSSGSGITPIADIQNDPSYIGKQVIIQGVVTIGAGVVATDWTKAYVQDNSERGINIYKSGTPVDPDLVRGNLVKITGQVDEYSGITEIVNYTVEVLATNQPLPTAIQLTTSAANDLTYEGTYINIKGIIEDKYVAGAGTTMEVNDGSGPVPIRVWDTAEINLNAYSTGDTVSVNGVMDIYQSAAQTLLGYQDDIEKSSLGPGGDGPSISNVQRTPVAPTPSDTVVVSADVTDNGTVSRVQLFMSFNSSVYDSVDMNLSTGDTYQAAIDSQQLGTVVQYYIKAYDNDGLSTTSTIYSYQVSQGSEITTIAEIRDNPSYIGQNVNIEAVVTIGSGVLTTDWTDTYVQDNSGRGINVYRGGTPVDADLVRGNLVRIRGEVAEFSGILEIINYTTTVIATNQPLPPATKISTNTAADTYWEGTYILIEGIIDDTYYAGGGTNVVVDDGSGPVTARAWDTAQINFDDYSVGDTIGVKGVVDIYQSSGQVLLAYQEDIFHTSLEAAGDGSGIVAVTPTLVETSASVNLDFTFTGNSQDTVTSVSVTLPGDWAWTGLVNDVSLSGEAFSSAQVAVNNNTVNITGAQLANQIQGMVGIQNLTSTDKDTLSVFECQTAAEGGTLTDIAKQPGVMVGQGTQQTITPIDSIQTNIEAWNGKEATIRAVVTIGSGILITSRTVAYVQDDSKYGIQVFSFDPPDKDLVRGNLVLITGTIDDYEEVTTEITDYTLSVLQEGVPLPEAQKISTAEAHNLDYEGTFVEVQGTIIDKYSAGGGTNILVDDGSGEIALRIWDTANLDLTEYNTGDGITTQGVIGEFSGTGQILVGYQEDISTLQLEKSPLLLKVPNKPFVPDQGETLPIIYSAGTENAHVTLRIYDMAGRLVATPVDEIGRSFEQTFEWNGTDQVNEQVGLGAYILFFEVVNNTDGTTEVKTAPIVVGTILKN